MAIDPPDNPPPADVDQPQHDGVRIGDNAQIQGPVVGRDYYDQRVEQHFRSDAVADLPPSPPFMAPLLPDDYVHRTVKFTAIYARVSEAQRGHPVAITAALRGAGGYGKTTLAKAVCVDPAICAKFPDGILWVELGQTPGDLTGRVQDWIYALTRVRPGFSGLDAATAHLRTLLAGRACLLVVDDVWNPAHLAPFLQGGPTCVHLITTRDRATLPIGSATVDLDAMEDPEAVRLLAAGLPKGEDVALSALATRLGQWPLLLKLVNGALRERVHDNGQRLAAALVAVNKALDKHGLTAFDPDSPAARNQAVASTLDASLALLHPAARARFGELAVFAEDADIPLTTLACLWGATGGYDPDDTEALCARLSRLSLLVRYDAGTGTIRLHDVVRKYLIQQLSDPPALHARLVDAWGEPQALPDAYAWTHLASHLVAAGREARLRQLLFDYGWLRAKLERAGSTALIADYDTLPADPAVRRVQGALRLSAHVLAGAPAHLPGQLWGRLDPLDVPAITTLLEEAKQATPGPWLRPLLPRLARPGGPLQRTLEGHLGAVLGLTVTPDGEKVISGGGDGTVRLWQLATGVLMRTLEGHTGAVRAVAVTPDGGWAVSGGDDGTLRAWNLDTETSVWTLSGHKGGVKAVALGPDGEFAISGGDDGTVRLWRLATGVLVRELAGHLGAVRAVAMSPDGGWAVSGGDDGTVRIWNPATGTPMRTLAGHTGGVEAVAVMPDGQRLVSSERDGTLRLWNLSTGALLLRLKAHTGAARAVAVRPSTGHVLSGGADGMLRIWDLASGSLQGTLVGHTWAVHTVAVTPDGDHGVSGSADGTLRVWDLALLGSPSTQEGHVGRLRAIAVTPDGQHAVSGGYDGTLRVWELAMGAAVRTLAGHRGPVRAVAVTPDGRHMISGGGEGTLRVWELTTGVLLRTLAGHRGPVRAVAVTADGQRAVSAGEDHTLRIWDLTTGAAGRPLEGHRRRVRALAVARDGRCAVSGGDDRTLRVWDLTTGALLHTLEGSENAVYAVAVTPDGRLVISGGRDRRLWVWDLTTQKPVRQLEGHIGVVRAVAVTPDGRWAISGGVDHTLRIWDLATGGSIAVFSGDTPFDCCAVASDGHTIVMGDGSGQVHFLHLENA